LVFLSDCCGNFTKSPCARPKVATIWGHQGFLVFSESYMSLDLKSTWWTFLQSSLSAVWHFSCEGGIRMFFIFIWFFEFELIAKHIFGPFQHNFMFIYG
jgi:hypothetical protein